MFLLLTSDVQCVTQKSALHGSSIVCVASGRISNSFPGLLIFVVNDPLVAGGKTQKGGFVCAVCTSRFYSPSLLNVQEASYRGVEDPHTRRYVT